MMLVNFLKCRLPHIDVIGPLAVAIILLNATFGSTVDSPGGIALPAVCMTLLGLLGRECLYMASGARSFNICSIYVVSVWLFSIFIANAGGSCVIAALAGDPTAFVHKLLVFIPICILFLAMLPPVDKDVVDSTGFRLFGNVDLVKCRRQLLGGLVGGVVVVVESTVYSYYWVLAIACVVCALIAARHSCPTTAGTAGFLAFSVGIIVTFSLIDVYNMLFGHGVDVLLTNVGVAAITVAVVIWSWTMLTRPKIGD